MDKIKNKKIKNYSCQHPAVAVIKLSSWTAVQTGLKFTSWTAGRLCCFEFHLQYKFQALTLIIENKIPSHNSMPYTIPLKDTKIST